MGVAGVVWAPVTPFFVAASSLACGPPRGSQAGNSWPRSGLQHYLPMLDLRGIKHAEAEGRGEDHMFRLTAVEHLRGPAIFQVLPGHGQGRRLRRAARR